MARVSVLGEDYRCHIDGHLPEHPVLPKQLDYFSQKIMLSMQDYKDAELEDAFTMLAGGFEKVKDQFREDELQDDVCLLHMVTRPVEFPRFVTQDQRIELLTQALDDDSISTTTAGKAFNTNAKGRAILDDARNA